MLELLSLVFTLALSIVLFAFLDWRALFQCRDETTCHESFSDYLVSKVSVCVLNLTFFSFPFISNPTAYARAIRRLCSHLQNFLLGMPYCSCIVS